MINSSNGILVLVPCGHDENKENVKIDSSNGILVLAPCGHVLGSCCGRYEMSLWESSRKSNA